MREDEPERIGVRKASAVGPTALMAAMAVAACVATPETVRSAVGFARTRHRERPRSREERREVKRRRAAQKLARRRQR